MTDTALTPEDIIRNALDGTLVQVDRDGKPRLAFVDKDFVPPYQNQWPLRARYEEDGPVPWTPEDDNMLIQFRLRDNMSFAAIAFVLNRSEDRVRRRAKMLFHLRRAA